MAVMISLAQPDKAMESNQTTRTWLEVPVHQSVGMDERNGLVQLAKVERRVALVEATALIIQQIQEVAPLNQLPNDHHVLVVRHKVQQLHDVPAPHTHRVVDLALDCH